MFESEEYRIVRRIINFISNKASSGRRTIVFFMARYIEPTGTYIMLRDGRILSFDDYRKMVSDGRINPQDAYVYIVIYDTPLKSTFYYPLLVWYHDFLSDYLYAYLSKLGFRYETIISPATIAPATDLKYVAVVDVYVPSDVEGYGKYLSIGVTNLDTVVNNLNLRKIMVEVLGSKIISVEKELTKEEYDKIYSMFISQKLFAGHNVREAWSMIDHYYNTGNQSLVKEVARITMDYNRIFNPYIVCYETKTWNEVDCSKINLD